MRSLLNADLIRMFRGRWFRLCALFMLALAAALALLQRTAMAYTVTLDRVLFLPMAFYGVAVAALTSLFIGEDFSGGMIKNKIVSGASRQAIYRSSLFACWIGCLAVYTLTALFTLALGVLLFPVNVTAGTWAAYFGLGVLTCLAYASIFSAISLLAGNRNTGVVICMLLSFAMLFLCLHTNSVLVQEAYKDGAANPAYMGGLKRAVYALLHDLNPSGQAAQLSAMQCLSPLRYIAMGLAWVALSALLGPRLFCRKDIRA